MPKTILIIENDAAFAEEMSGALDAMGYRVRTTGDGKDGLEIARDLRPDAIVLCVELPRLSGYSICNKLKKDEALRAIPLILTSSEATHEVFEEHRKLKVRAEDYLIKPYVSATLLERLSALIGVPTGSAPTVSAATADGPVPGDEEVVSLEEELGLEPFAGEPGDELPSLDLDSLPDEPAMMPAGSGDLDEDLRLLDDAFDGISAPSLGLAPAPALVRPPSDVAPGGVEEQRAAHQAIEKALGVDRPVTSEDLEAVAASLPDEDEAGAPPELPPVGEEAELALQALGDAPQAPAASAFDALDGLGLVDEPSVGPAAAAVAVAAGAVTAGGAAAVAAAGGAVEAIRLERELADGRAALKAHEATIGELRAKLHDVESALRETEAEAASHKARGDTVATQARKAEAEARTAHDQARLATEQARAAEARGEAADARAAAAEARARASEQETAAQRRAVEQSAASLAARSAELAAAQISVARLGAAEREVERIGSELTAARSEAAAAVVELEKRSSELTRRISELEAANAKNEERVVKAYLKIKGDEKVRDKARKALTIALQLLDEGLPPEPPGEKRSPVRE
jgi:CheY-like chemotaxis protein